MGQVFCSVFFSRSCVESAVLIPGTSEIADKLIGRSKKRNKIIPKTFLFSNASGFHIALPVRSPSSLPRNESKWNRCGFITGLKRPIAQFRTRGRRISTLFHEPPMKKIFKWCGILFGGLLMVILIIAAIAAIGSTSVERKALGTVLPGHSAVLARPSF